MKKPKKIIELIVEVPSSCAQCGARSPNPHYMCDKQIGVIWCAKCFPNTACGLGKHGEWCPTLLYEGWDHKVMAE